jgi:hypothetical protein
VDSLQLAVEIDDGSRTIGTLCRNTIGITTPYATLEVPVGLIKSVAFKDQHGTAAIQLENGDKLQGVLKLDVLELNTRLGSLSIPVGIIRSITMRMKQGNLESGLLAYYPFDGNARDASGNSNNGILRGVTPTEDQFGRPGSAYLFDGVDDYVKIPYSTSLQFQTQISLCGWVCPNGFYQGHCLANDIVRKGTRDEERGIFFLRYGISCDDDFVPEEERFSFGVNLNGELGSEWVAGTSPVRPGVWFFVAGTYDGSVLKVYVNGVLEGTVPASGTISNIGRDLTIGGNVNSQFPYRVNGVLDDIRIYNRALSEDEIRELYHRR